MCFTFAVQPRFVGSHLGSVASGSLARKTRVTVKHIRAWTRGTKEAIKYSPEEIGTLPEAQQDCKHFHHWLFIRAAVVHPNGKQTFLWAWKSRTEWHCCIAVNDQSLPCTAQPSAGATDHSSFATIAWMNGSNLWNAWIGRFWEITLYNLAQKAGANFAAFQGPADLEN